MGTLTPVFQRESRTVHHEHNVLIQHLAALDSALDHLECCSEVFVNLAPAKQVQIYAKHLAEELPEHFRREEETVLATVARVSPELETFGREMKRQHEGLRARLNEFCFALQQLEAAEDRDEAIRKLKDQGKELTRQLGRHIALEEKELSGFL